MKSETVLHLEDAVFGVATLAEVRWFRAGRQDAVGAEVHVLAAILVDQRAPVRRPHLTHEYMTSVDADANREPSGFVGDSAQRAQHPTFVVAHRSWRAGDEDDLAAVTVNIGAEEGDALLLHRVLHIADQLVERGGNRIGTLVLDHGVDIVEVDERDRGVAVL